jgi:hypothetical protein
MTTKRELQEDFEAQAEWRREKAAEYPDDTRNLEAAVIWDRLAATVQDIPAEVIDAFNELFEDLPDSEQWSQMQRDVGFHAFPENARELVDAFIRNRTSE